MFCRLLPGSGGQQVRSTVPLPPRTAVNEQQIDMPVFPNEFLCACDYELECTVSDGQLYVFIRIFRIWVNFFSNKRYKSTTDLASSHLTVDAARQYKLSLNSNT